MTIEEAREWLVQNQGIEYSYTTKQFEAYKIALNALEKQIPKKPLDFGDEAYLCPCCKRNNFYKGAYLDKQSHCDNCGQAIDWSDAE